jgi:hypothetical protein
LTALSAPREEYFHFLDSQTPTLLSRRCFGNLVPWVGRHLQVGDLAPAAEMGLLPEKNISMSSSGLARIGVNQLADPQASNLTLKGSPLAWLFADLRGSE